MAAALREQLAQPEITRLDFLERLGLLIDREASVRESARLRARLHRAQLRQQACIEDLDYRVGRGLDKRLMLHLAGCDWIRQHQNVIVTGPTGAGKSFIACASPTKRASKASRPGTTGCRACLKTWPLARGDGRYLKLLHALSRPRCPCPRRLGPHTPDKHPTRRPT